MTVSGDYSTPVMVNGYACRNCTDVDNAKKHIDPAHPQDGPFGIDKKNDPAALQRESSATFGGLLAGFANGRGDAPTTVGRTAQNAAAGNRIDVLV